MEKRIYKLMDAKGRVLIPKELRVETGIGYGDIVALEIADGKVTLRKVTVIEPGDPGDGRSICEGSVPYNAGPFKAEPDIRPIRAFK